MLHELLPLIVPHPHPICWLNYYNKTDQPLSINCLCVRNTYVMVSCKPMEVLNVYNMYNYMYIYIYKLQVQVYSIIILCGLQRHFITEAVLFETLLLLTCSGASLYMYTCWGRLDCPTATELDPHKPDQLTNLTDKHNQVNSQTDTVWGGSWNCNLT